MLLLGSLLSIFCRCSAAQGLHQACTQVLNWMQRQFRCVSCRAKAPYHVTTHIKTSCLLQDKDGKMAYLQKMIDCVSNALGEQVLAKPAKVRPARLCLIPDHHQQTTAICALFLCLTPLTTSGINAADCGWSGTRADKHIPTDAGKSSCWTSSTGDLTKPQASGPPHKLSHQWLDTVSGYMQSTPSMQQPSAMQPQAPASAMFSSSPVRPVAAAPAPSQMAAMPSPQIQTSQNNLVIFLQHTNYTEIVIFFVQCKCECRA